MANDWNVRGMVRCTACGTKTGRSSSFGLPGHNFCQPCFNDLREYCRSFGEVVSQQRIERWLRLVAAN